MSTEQFWLSIGFLAQACFGMRFIIQWVASESRKESVVPVAFWIFSVCGGLTMLGYAIHRRDPVFIVAEVIGISIYLRNLHFLRTTRRR
jgi:lipid-A-disaccharide synthase-like uncharacterized protein